MMRSSSFPTSDAIAFVVREEGKITTWVFYSRELELESVLSPLHFPLSLLLDDINMGPSALQRFFMSVLTKIGNVLYSPRINGKKKLY